MRKKTYAEISRQRHKTSVKKGIKDRMKLKQSKHAWGKTVQYTLEGKEQEEYA